MLSVYFLFFFKQKTAYEMRISDWSSDVCSSDLAALRRVSQADGVAELMGHYFLKQQRRLAVELAMPRIERNIALDQAARVRLAERQGTWLPRRASGTAHHVSAIHLSRAPPGFTEIVRLDAKSLPFCCGGRYASQRCIRAIGRGACRERGGEYGEHQRVAG